MWVIQMPKILNTFFFLAPWSPNHWTAREFPEQILIFTDLHLSLRSNKKMTHIETTKLEKTIQLTT